MIVLAVVLFVIGVVLVLAALLREYYRDDAELFHTAVDETKKRP